MKPFFQRGLNRVTRGFDTLLHDSFHGSLILLTLHSIPCCHCQGSFLHGTCLSASRLLFDAVDLPELIHCVCVCAVHACQTHGVCTTSPASQPTAHPTTSAAGCLRLVVLATGSAGEQPGRLRVWDCCSKALTKSGLSHPLVHFCCRCHHSIFGKTSV